MTSVAQLVQDFGKPLPFAVACMLFMQVATVLCAILVPIPWCYFRAFLHTRDKVAVTFGGSLI